MKGPTILAADGLHHDGTGEVPQDLRPLVSQLCGQRFRRTTRFVDLALIGANRCVRDAGRRPGPSCAVYLATGRCNAAGTIEQLRQLIRDRLPPMPVAFMNTASNAAAFHVALSLGLTGENMTVSHAAFPFAAALELAWLALAEGCFDEVLVGGVDELTFPVADHRRRLGLAPGTPVGEGSHWLWLARDGEGIGELAAVERYPDDDALAAALPRPGVEGAVLAGGRGTDAVSLERLAAAAGISDRFAYLERAGHYDSNTAFAIVDYLKHRPGPLLLHLDRGPDGDWSLIAVRPPPA